MNAPFAWRSANGSATGNTGDEVTSRRTRFTLLRALLLSAGWVLACVGALVAPVCAQTVHLRAVGDIMLAEDVGRLMARRGRSYPFAAMRATLRDADLTFGNLECSASTRGKPIPKKFNFRADPTLLPVLKENGFKIVSLANNHTWDFGRDALLDTVLNVQKTGVATVGAGANRTEAHQLVIMKCKDLRIGFLAYLGLIPALVAESETQPSLSMASIEAITRDVQAARPRVDVLIVSLHAGQEGASGPTPRQQGFAQAAIDAGADLVIGHHPHVRQPLVLYKGKPICYSLGNFVFSTTGRGSGQMLDAILQPNHQVQARVVPLILDSSQPRLAHPASSVPTRPFRRKP